MEKITESDIKKLEKNIQKSIKTLNLIEKKKEVEKLKKQTLETDFWDIPEQAKNVMQKINDLQEDIDEAGYLEDSIETLVELYEITSENDKSELIEEYKKIKKRFKKFRKIQFLSGKYDHANVIMSLHAGQGGTESNDWVAMLTRMYTKYAESRGWKVEIEHMAKGTETGFSSITLFFYGKNAYGLLKKEAGTHRLVRLSPFNAQNLRQTSFAGVEVIPEIPKGDESDIEIPDSDLEFKAVRASGPGGQGVNKTASAVQLTHVPTQITIHSSQRRSQEQNREVAMKILKAKLWEIEERKREEKLDKIKGEYKAASWGNQIRNYVLHPYKMVKDLRTGVESSAPDDILDGKLDKFIEAEIKL